MAAAPSPPVLDLFLPLHFVVFGHFIILSSPRRARDSTLVQSVARRSIDQRPSGPVPRGPASSSVIWRSLSCFRALVDSLSIRRRRRVGAQNKVQLSGTVTGPRTSTSLHAQPWHPVQTRARSVVPAGHANNQVAISFSLSLSLSPSYTLDPLTLCLCSHRHRPLTVGDSPPSHGLFNDQIDHIDAAAIHHPRRSLDRLHAGAKAIICLLIDRLTRSWTWILSQSGTPMTRRRSLYDRGEGLFEGRVSCPGGSNGGQRYQMSMMDDGRRSGLRSRPGSHSKSASSLRPLAGGVCFRQPVGGRNKRPLPACVACLLASSADGIMFATRRVPFSYLTFDFPLAVERQASILFDGVSRYCSGCDRRRRLRVICMSPSTSYTGCCLFAAHAGTCAPHRRLPQPSDGRTTGPPPPSGLSSRELLFAAISSASVERGLLDRRQLLGGAILESLSSLRRAQAAMQSMLFSAGYPRPAGSEGRRALPYRMDELQVPAVQ